MSDEYQLRRDVNKINRFLETLEYNLQTEFNIGLEDLNKLLADLKVIIYDKSDVYNKSEIDELINQIEYKITALDERVTALEEEIQNANQ